MSYLMRSCFFLFFLFAFLFSACSNRGALTPEKAFAALYSVFNTQDTALMQELLSSESLLKIESMLNTIRAMSDEQASAASKLYGISAAELKNMTLDSFIMIFLSTQKDVILIGNAALVDVFEQDGRAIARLKNGNELDFVKEGRYWKFDLTGL